MERWLLIRLIVLLMLIVGLNSCYTPAKEAEVKEELFNLQTRLLQLERQNKERGSTDKTAKVTLASSQSDIDRIKIDIQRINGDLDALKVGVKSGEMPGTLPEDGSVAKTLKDILARLESIEQLQKQTLDNPASPDKTKTKEGSKEKTLAAAKAAPTTIKALKTAYDAKRYEEVAENAPKVMAHLKTKISKEEVLFLQAESFYKMNKMRDAALKYNEIMELNPNSSQGPLVLLRMGDCFRSLGDSATAKLYYEDLEKRHPSSEYAAKAKEYLKQIQEKGAAVKAKSPKTKVVQKAPPTAKGKVAGKDKTQTSEKAKSIAR